MTNKEALIELKSIDSEAFAYMSDRQCEALDLAIKALERSQGEWIVDKSNRFGDRLNCSICGARPRRSEYGYDLHDNFCHNCGADMRKGDAENG